MSKHTAPAGPAVDREPRCWRCTKLLAEELTQPWRIRCTRAVGR